MTTQTTIPPVNVYKKIHAVMSAIDVIPESGEHKQGWSYATAKDVEREVRHHMNAVGLILIPHMLGYEWTDNRYVVQFQFDLIDSETGDMLSSHWYGESMTIQTTSKGTYPDDKAINKCATNAQKYFLKRTFLLATGEDVDSDANDNRSHQPVDFKQEAEKRELSRMKQTLFQLVESYFGDKPHNGSGKTKTTRAGALLMMIAGVRSSSELTKDQLVDLLALMQSHIDKRKTARQLSPAGDKSVATATVSEPEKTQDDDSLSPIYGGDVAPATEGDEPEMPAIDKLQQKLAAAKEKLGLDEPEIDPKKE